MANPEHVEIVKQGAEAIGEWREAHPSERLDLSGAELSEADLSVADLSEARLRGTDLRRTNLFLAELRLAELSGANLIAANLSGANLSGVDLRWAKLGWTGLANVDLSACLSLETANHSGPSTVGVDTLVKSQGKIPDEFLRGCGLEPWQIEFAKLHDPHMPDDEICEIISTKLFTARTQGPLYLGGVFISYSWDDSKFVDKLHGKLYEAGASVWLDRHDATAGRLERQVSRAIRIQDITVVVLSEKSLDSDWVWQEIEWARKKEKEEGRDVLCPVALDNTWEKHKGDAILMRQLKQYNMLDFSKWNTKAFDTPFDKLLRGLRQNYGLGFDRQDKS